MARPRVYLVEDDRDFRDLTRLRLEGYVEVVGEGEEMTDAVAGIREAEPDVVLLDFSLLGSEPPTSAVHRIRSAWPRANVALYSGMPESVLEEASSSTGVSYLGKRVSVDELVEAVWRLSG